MDPGFDTSSYTWSDVETAGTYDVPKGDSLSGSSKPTPKSSAPAKKSSNTKPS